MCRNANTLLNLCKSWKIIMLQVFRVFLNFFLFLINPYNTETYTEHVQFKDNAKSRFVLMIF